MSYIFWRREMEEVKDLQPINTDISTRDLIQSLVHDLDQTVNFALEEYKKSHDQLNTYRGVQITDDNIKEVNNALEAVQNCFAALYPAFNFINYRYKQAVNATHDYNNFIDSLKKAGANEVNPMPLQETK